MDTTDRTALYSGIVALCQSYGFTTEHTYDLIDQVIDSLGEDKGEDAEDAPDAWIDASVAAEDEARLAQFADPPKPPEPRAAHPHDLP